MKLSSLFEIILIIAIVVILSKLYISISGKFFKLYINDIKQRINLPSMNCIYFCYPHTSYWDGFFSISSSLLLSIFTQQTPLFPVAAHHSLPGFVKKYTFPVGKVKNQTAKIAERLQQSEFNSLYIAPEGTRAKRNKIKKGFYYIAQKTKFPIVCSTINFSSMKTFYSDPISVEGKTIKQVFQEIKNWYNQFNLEDHCVKPENMTPLVI